MDAAPAHTLVCVQCDIDLLRRGIERAATRVGLRITYTEADAAFLVRHTNDPVSDRTARAVMTVEDNVVSIATTSALDPTLWAAVGRLANEVLGRHQSHRRVETT